MQTLFVDIETSPNTAHVWSLWKQTVSLSQLMESSYTMCWAAKWADSEQVFFDSVYQSSSKKMIKGIHALLNEADMIVHYHGTNFDIPTLNKEFLLHDLAPPSPSKQLDLLRVVREKFRFPSNKLDYVAQRLGLGGKHDHEGHMLWVKCMNNDPAAWKAMQKYNQQDVVLLEKLYHKLTPWIKGHLNYSVFTDAFVCPTCGSAEYQRRGYAYTSASKYQRYQCKACHGWFRGHTNVRKTKGKFMGI
jgi:DNA polymerase elongation subunit (family B)